MKRCPTCGLMAALSSSQCVQCGHKYTTHVPPPQAPQPPVQTPQMPPQGYVQGAMPQHPAAVNNPLYLVNTGLGQCPYCGSTNLRVNQGGGGCIFGPLWFVLIGWLISAMASNKNGRACNICNNVFSVQPAYVAPPQAVPQAPATPYAAYQARKRNQNAVVIAVAAVAVVVGMIVFVGVIAATDDHGLKGVKTWTAAHAWIRPGQIRAGMSEGEVGAILGAPAKSTIDRCLASDSDSCDWNSYDRKTSEGLNGVNLCFQGGYLIGGGEMVKTEDDESGGWIPVQGSPKDGELSTAHYFLTNGSIVDEHGNAISETR